MSIGLDISAVFLLLTGEPAVDARMERARMERAHAAGEVVLVTDLVLAEDARHRSEGAITPTFDKKMSALEGAVRLGRG